jgi:peptidoglycan/xylan/chitin deacetylase (PgdA/CDA1 family)
VTEVCRPLSHTAPQPCSKAPLRVAAITLDVEDWWHLDYLHDMKRSAEYSMLDGVDTFLLAMSELKAQGTLFVLGELASQLRPSLQNAAELGHELACHGWGHHRPLFLSLDEFRKDALRAKEAVESAIGRRVAGYRAPCYSLDRRRLDELIAVGFEYDSSKIRFGDHPLYGDLDMNCFSEPMPGLWIQGEFVEFEITTVMVAGRRLPISGGGYLRLFPWVLMRLLLRDHLLRGDFYILYIHPFELSARPTPFDPKDGGWGRWARFSIGRRGAVAKLRTLIELLQLRGYTLMTLSALRNELLQRTKWEGAS